jgi:hypothetical protein
MKTRTVFAGTFGSRGKRFASRYVEYDHWTSNGLSYRANTTDYSDAWSFGSLGFNPEAAPHQVEMEFNGPVGFKAGE